MRMDQNRESSDSFLHPTTTPAETVVGDDDTGKIERDSPTVPRAGCVFVIRSTTCGRSLMLRDGEVILAHHDDHGSPYWRCEESKGWFGFRNVVSGRLLGYDPRGRLRCSAERHLEWENFVVRPVLGGGYVLYMTQKDALWSVGTVKELGTEKLAKIEGGCSQIVWEFIGRLA